MDTLIFQSVLLLLAAFIGGCMLGCWMKRVFTEQEVGVSRPIPDEPRRSTEPMQEDAPVVASATAAEDVPLPDDGADDAVAVEPAPDEVAPASTMADAEDTDTATAAEPDVSGVRPAGLSEPDEGRADDLKRISGVGKKLEEKLNEIGVWHFRQIAAWSEPEIEWVNDHIGFPGRIQRDEWQAQAETFMREDAGEA